MFYPTATMELQMGLSLERSWVIVAPNLPVYVFLRSDIYPLEQEPGMGWSLAVWTGATSKEMEKRLETMSIKDMAQTSESMVPQGVTNEPLTERDMQRPDGEVIVAKAGQDILQADSADFRKWQP